MLEEPAIDKMLLSHKGYQDTKFHIAALIACALVNLILATFALSQMHSEDVARKTIVVTQSFTTID